MISFSSMVSAKSFFSRAFSVSSSLRRLASETFMPPNLLRRVMTQPFLHKSGCQCVHLSRCFHAQGLVRAPVVVEADPVGNHSACGLQGLEAVPMHALVLQRADHPLDHAVLLRAVGGDERLLQAMALDQCVWLRLVNTRPVWGRSKKGSVAFPKRPWRVIRACASADSAVFGLLLPPKCQPSSARLRQSLTKASSA